MKIKQFFNKETAKNAGIGAAAGAVAGIGYTVIKATFGKDEPEEVIEEGAETEEVEVEEETEEDKA